MRVHRAKAEATAARRWSRVSVRVKVQVLLAHWSRQDDRGALSGAEAMSTATLPPE